MKRILAALLILVVPSVAAADGPRRVFVLHSGVHIYYSNPDKDYAAKVMRRELLSRGIPERDIVIVPNPFPTASKDDPFPREGLLMFLDASDPASKFSQDAYRRLHKTLVDAKVEADAHLVWIGYSAGGQVGMTMANLASRLEDFPELKKATRAGHFDAVFAIGTPTGADVTPENVKLCCYCSPADKVVQLACGFTPILPLLGYDMKICPAPFRPRGNTIVRWFDAIEHPYWIHIDRVLDRVLQDLDRREPPRWRREPAALPGMSLSQGLCNLLADRCRVSLEDPPAEMSLPKEHPDRKR